MSMEESPFQERQAAREYCSNCATLLQGVYCHNCGQSTWSTTRYFGTIIHDLLDNLFSYDSRVIRTLPRLMTAPGILCRDYLSGKRNSYLPPFRLYLFASIIFFLVIPMLNEISVYVNEDSVAVTATDPDDNMAGFKSGVHVYAGIPEDISGQSDQVLKDKFKTFLMTRPGEFMKATLNSLPTMMFILLPVLAMTLKICYFKSRGYYMEHLIIVLFGQSYLFFMLLFILLISRGQEVLADIFPSWVILNTASGILVILSYILIPVQLFTLQKQVYEQSTAITVIKFVAVAVIYFILLVATFILAVVWNIVTF